MQAPFRILATAKLKQIRASSRHQNPITKRHTYLLNNINSKLVKEGEIIVKADKGKPCVIIRTNDYNKKIHDFLTNNNFQKLQKDPTSKYQQHITKASQHSNLIVLKNQIIHLIQKKTQIALLKGPDQNTHTRQPHHARG
jgi:hypothetical protein